MSTTYAVYLGHVLRERRNELKINLREVPGVAIGYLSNVERGVKNVSPELLECICAAINIEVYEVLERTAKCMRANRKLAWPPGK